MKARPEGQLRGHPRRRDDPNSAFLRSGMTEAGIPELNETRATGIKVVFEKNTDNWDTDERQEQHGSGAQPPTATRSTPFSPRTTAWRPASSRRSAAVGLKIPVSGQDGDTAALNRVALGHPGRLGLEERVRPRQDRRQRRGTALRQDGTDRDQGSERPPGRRGSRVAQRHSVHDPGRQDRPVDHPHPDRDHQGQREGHDRRWLGHQGAVCAGVTAGSSPACG